MDLDEWYETVQRWRAPATGRRWRRVPQVGAVALLALTVALAATQLSDGGGSRTVGPLAAGPPGLPIKDAPPPAVVSSTVTTTSTTTPAPSAVVPVAPTQAPTTAPPTTTLSAPTVRPAGVPTTAAPAPPRTTAAPSPGPPGPPSPPPSSPPAGPPRNTGRLSADMGARPSPAGVGQPVTFSASWSDSNGRLASMGIEYGDGGGDSRNGAPCGPGPAGPNSGSEAFTHAFGAPGTYTVRLHVHTDDCTGGRQATVVTLTIRVQ